LIDACAGEVGYWALADTLSVVVLGVVEVEEVCVAGGAVYVTLTFFA
jgi:hypothetical protein